MPFPLLTYIGRQMFNNIESLLRSIELQVEIKELREAGLTEEEIQGYIEFYYDSFVIVENNLILN